MAKMTKFGFHCATMALKEKLGKLSELEKSMPVFEGPDVDLMTEGSSIDFYCPLGCRENLVLQENTLGAMGDLIQAHLKECKKSVKSNAPTDFSYLAKEPKGFA